MSGYAKSFDETKYLLFFIIKRCPKNIKSAVRFKQNLTANQSTIKNILKLK